MENRKDKNPNEGNIKYKLTGCGGLTLVFGVALSISVLFSHSGSFSDRIVSMLFMLVVSWLAARVVSFLHRLWKERKK